MRTSVGALLGAAAVVSAIAGCGSGADEPDSDEPDGQTLTATAPPAEGPGSEGGPSSEVTPGLPVRQGTGVVPAFPEGTAPQRLLTPGGGDLVLSDVRVVERAGFDRVVMEFGGAETPGWQVRYVDTAISDPTGRVVALRGDAILRIVASQTTWPAPSYYPGPRRFRPDDDGGDVVDVVVEGTFEGLTGVFVGIDGDRRPFRVFARADPARLLVDLQADRAR